jgi:starvation-inducible outer membrane lipoprotein
MSKQYCVVALLLLVFLLSSCGFDHDSSLNKAEYGVIEVSIIQLIANPSDYHGQKVRVEGVGHIAFERCGLFLGKDDRKYSICANGLWLELGEKATPFKKARRYNGKYVLVEGTFDMENKGHLGMYSGAIVDVTRYVYFSWLYPYW